jgi:hypothetical protein
MYIGIAIAGIEQPWTGRGHALERMVGGRGVAGKTGELMP